MGEGVAVGQDVSVDDDVHVVFNGGVHGGVGRFLGLGRIGEVAALACVHGDAKEVRAVGSRVGDGLFCSVLGEPLDAVAAHAMQLHRRAVLVAELRPLHVEFSVLRHAAARLDRGRGGGRDRGRVGQSRCFLARENLGAADDGAGLGPGQAAFGVEPALVVPRHHAAAVCRQDLVVVPPVQRGEVGHFRRLRDIVAGLVWRGRGRSYFSPVGGSSSQSYHPASSAACMVPAAQWEEDEDTGSSPPHRPTMETNSAAVMVRPGRKVPSG